MSIPKICPVLLMDNPVHMSKCRKDSCAWWDELAGACCMASGTDYLRAVSNSLEELAQQKTPASAANAGEGRVEQSLPDTDSTSHDNGKWR